MTDTLTRPSAIATEYRACRLCGAEQLATVLDLGAQAISDFYRVVPVDEPRAPLCLVQCGQCGLVQLSHSVEKDRLYRSYYYRSGLNEKMVTALQNVVEEARQWTDLRPGDTVLDIGSNDGTLLNAYPAEIATIGYDPSNIECAIERHVIHRAYYPPPPDVRSANVKVITSVAVFYDVDDPTVFVQRVKRDLHPDGVWICQMMDLDAMLKTNAVDNICHEHTVYWSISSFSALCQRQGLRVVGVSRNAVNGGSVRFIVEHSGIAMNRLPAAYPSGDLESFAYRAEDRKDATVKLLKALKAQGKTVVGYGASTKGATLLQWYGIGPDLLPSIAERNPEKVGCVTAGMHIPIISEEQMRAEQPDYLFILPWAFTDAFVQREAALRAQGTRFIVPLPELRVL